MKFTLGWLKDHLETDASLEKICETLNIVGFEVEGVSDPADALSAFVVARVLEAKQHPDADKLRVCMVDFGGGSPIQVVCGAPNARTGMVGVFAPEGTYVPGTELLLKKAKIRGVESSGMLCSERELQLSDEHEGIIDLDAALDARVGERYIDVAGLNDPMIEIGITPNRPDALGVRGIARDLAAAGIGKLKKDPLGGTTKGKFPCPVNITLDFPSSAENACPLFAGRVIRNLKNGPSPDWMQRRLIAIGLRPINALVDVTNYVSYDRARPLHVFDAGKLNGDVGARLGRTGESFAALDGKTYEVNEEQTVIADDKGPLAYGGIMGGEVSGSTAATTEVLIESAYFDPVRTANTGRATGILSDARYRFERGIDPASAVEGLEVATRLILGVCGGEASEITVAGAVPDCTPVIPFDPKMVERLTGLVVKDAQVKKTLKSLGFSVEGKGRELSITVPSWRPDVHGAADLVEEVVRIVGIDSVPPVAMERGSGVGRAVLTDGQRRVRAARRVLASRGLVEAVNWSFVTDEEAGLFGGGGQELRLANPISSELSSMRPSLIAGLLNAAQRNRDRSINDPALFEVGQVFDGDGEDQQFTAAAGVRAGSAQLTGAGRHWLGVAGAVDVFTAKADLMALLSGLGLDPEKLQITRDVPGWFHPGRSGAVKLGPKVTLGVFGEVHPGVLAALEVDGPAVAFEARLENLPAARRKTRSKGALNMSDYQPVRRDFAFVVDSDTLASDLVRAARGADKSTISEVRVFDVFEGRSLGDGKKSIAIEVTMQPTSATLTDEDIDAVSQKVVAQVKKATNGEIRA